LSNPHARSVLRITHEFIRELGESKEGPGPLPANDLASGQEVGRSRDQIPKQSADSNFVSATQWLS